MNKITKTKIAPCDPKNNQQWVLRRHYDENGTLLLIDTAPANLAAQTPPGEYSNRATRRALVKAGLRERVERLNH